MSQDDWNEGYVTGLIAGASPLPTNWLGSALLKANLKYHMISDGGIKTKIPTPPAPVFLNNLNLPLVKPGNNLNFQYGVFKLGPFIPEPNSVDLGFPLDENFPIGESFSSPVTVKLTATGLTLTS